MTKIFLEIEIVRINAKNKREGTKLTKDLSSLSTNVTFPENLQKSFEATRKQKLSTRERRIIDLFLLDKRNFSKKKCKIRINMENKRKDTKLTKDLFSLSTKVTFPENVILLKKKVSKSLEVTGKGNVTCRGKLIIENPAFEKPRGVEKSRYRIAEREFEPG